MAEQIITAENLPALREWFDFNYSTGCTIGQLRETLLGSGYGKLDVEGFLADAVARATAREAADLYDADAVGSGEEAVQRLWRRLDVINAFNQISLGDRTVRILAKNIGCGIYFIADFLAAEECAALTSGPGASLSRSLVFDEDDGTHLRTGSRSSHGATLRRGGSPMVRRIESRLSRLTALPISHGEDLQILRYTVGGEYRPHFDYFDPATPGGARVLAQQSQRLATVILYLGDVEGGGATLFPELSLAFTPVQGAALLFTSMARDGSPLPTSLHCGCPVASGEKWIATKWFRHRPHAVTGR